MKTIITVTAFVLFGMISNPVLSQTVQSAPVAPAGSSVDQGTLRLHMDMSALHYRYDVKNETSGPFHLFWSNSPFVHFGVGYAVIDRLLLGARVGFGYTDARPDDHDPGSHYMIRFGALPYVEYLFFPREWLSPFVTAQLGVEGVETPKTSNWNFVGGAGGGVHFFLIPQFSMDLTGLVSYHGGHDRLKGNDPAPRDPVPLHLISTSVLFGLSGWL